MSGCQLSLIIFFILQLCHGQSSTHYYRLNLKTNKCESQVDNLKPVDPISFLDYPGIDKDFISKHPECVKTKVCLYPNRKQFLIWNGLIPQPINYTDIKKKLTESKCEVSLNNANTDSILKLRNRITQEFEKAPEAVMTVKMIDQTKSHVQEYLKASQNSINALIKCFEIDQNLEKQGIKTNEDKIKTYNPLFNSKNRDTYKLCEYIWLRNSEFQSLQQNLMESRLSLFTYQLLNSGVIETDKDFLALAEGLNFAPSAPIYKNLTQIRLKPLKGKILNSSLQSDFWSDTSASLEPLNNFEKKKLLKFIIQTKEKYPKLSLKEAMALNYFDKISADPLLIYLDVARPTGKDYLQALRFHKNKIPNDLNLYASDDKYLNFTPFFEEFLKTENAEDRGDYCVLNHYMLSSRKSHEESPSRVAAMLMSFKMGKVVLEGAQLIKNGGVALELAPTWKFSKKFVYDILTASPLSGLVLSSTSLSRSMERYLALKKTCSSTYQTSNELCNVGRLENSYTDNTLMIGMTLFFSGSKGRKILLPLSLRGDVDNK